MQKQYWAFHSKYNEIIKKYKYLKIITIKSKLAIRKNTIWLPLDSLDSCLYSASTREKSDQTNVCDF